MVQTSFRGAVVHHTSIYRFPSHASSSVASYVFHITRTGFVLLVLLTMVGAINYARITLGAIFQPNHSALTPLSLRFYLGMLHVLSHVCSHMRSLHGFCDATRRRYRDLSDCYREGFLIGKQNAAKAIISKKSSEIDAHVLAWTLQCIGEDDALESFLEAIPGFFESKSVNILEEHLPDQFRTTFGHGLNAFSDRTFLSDSVSESVKSHRLVICLDAAYATLGSNGVSHILDEILNGRRHGALQSVEVGHSLRHWNNEQFSLQLRRILIQIISRVRKHDGHWMVLVKDELGIPDRVLQDCMAHGDSVSLAILIHITRQFFHSDFPRWDPEILRALPSFDVRNTLSGLQQDFCALWNEVVQEARKLGAGSAPVLFLREIRHHVYIALHRGAVASPTSCSVLTIDDDDILSEPLSYPLCDIAAHHSSLTPLGRIPSTLPSSDHPRQRTADILDTTHQLIHVPAPSLSSLPIPTAPIGVLASDSRRQGSADISADGSSANVIPLLSSSDRPPRRLHAEISIPDPPSASSPAPHSPVPVIIGLSPRATTSLGIFQARENTSDLRPHRLDPLAPDIHIFDGTRD
jgi:hypothetical protein